MPSESSGSQTIRFGTFELDVRAGELRKQGVRIRLQEQPLRILEMLLAHPGQLVTREELRSKLWPSNTFVDFDHGLNKAINKLREALGDSAESPRFVETVGRRGYRFIAEVKLGDSEPARNPTIASQPILAEAPPVLPEAVSRPDLPNSSRLRSALLALAAVLVVGGALVTWKVYSHNRSPVIRSVA